MMRRGGHAFIRIEIDNSDWGVGQGFAVVEHASCEEGRGRQTEGARERQNFQLQPDRRVPSLFDAEDGYQALCELLQENALFFVPVRAGFQNKLIQAGLRQGDFTPPRFFPEKNRGIEAIKKFVPFNFSTFFSRRSERGEPLQWGHVHGALLKRPAEGDVHIQMPEFGV